MRIAIAVEYDGAGFSGWQTQRGERTVQETLETALSQVAHATLSVQCAGRTDAGVHATFQVAHFDTMAQRSARSWVLGANANLPDDVSVIWAGPVDDTFHARFSAFERGYHYLVCARQSRPGLWHRRVTWEYRELDVERMQQATRHLLGEHDFSAFRARGCQARSPVRTITELRVEGRSGLIVLSVRANAFLQHMVRNIAGVLLEIGMGRQPPVWARTVLESRQRECGGVTAPPHGLYLTAVRYPEHFGIPLPSDPVPQLPFFPGRAF